MPQLPKIIFDFLLGRNITYEVILHEPAKSFQEISQNTQINLSNIVRAVVMRGAESPVMVVLPADQIIDFSALEIQNGCKMEPIDKAKARRIFSDCEENCIPPLPAAYGLIALIDNSLANSDTVFIQSGVRGVLLKLKGGDFAKLQYGYYHGSFGFSSNRLSTITGFETGTQESVEKEVLEKLQPSSELIDRRKIKDKLPTIPGLAQMLLRLRNDENASVRDLVEIIDKDPTISAHVIRQASSSFYAYQGKLDSLQDATSRVLGYNMVMDMSLGYAASSAFKIDADGPLGVEAFWLHAVHSAELMQAIAKQMSSFLHVKPGVAYLCGLLHNFGYLLLAQQYQSQFFLLNKLFEKNPQADIIQLENMTTGVKHTELGDWLMKSWEMPEEIIVSIREHHNKDYEGDFAVYAHLIYLTDYLLREREIGEGPLGEYPVEITKKYRISQPLLEEILDQHFAAQDHLDAVAQKLGA